MVCFGDVGFCESGMCPGVGLASFCHLHLPKDVVCLHKLAFEGALSGTNPDYPGLVPIRLGNDHLVTNIRVNPHQLGSYYRGDR